MPTNEHLIDAAGRWRAELEQSSGRDALVDYQDQATSTLDLATAHPSGLAQFLAGRETPLSSMFRDPVALADARRRARVIRLEANRLADQHGVRSAFVLTGIATWTSSDGRAHVVNAPILMHPLSIHPRAGERPDEDLVLSGPAKVNPALIRLLGRDGVQVDPSVMEARTATPHGLDPRPAFDLLYQAAQHLPGFGIADRTVAGNFLDVVPSMVGDLDQLTEANPVVSALAARACDLPVVRPAQESPAEDAQPAEQAEPSDPRKGRARGLRRLLGRTEEDRPTGAEPDGLGHEVLALDAEQRAVLDLFARGESLRVLAGPGSGATQLIAQAVVDAAGRGQSVLVVAAQRAELADLVARLEELGLGGLIADPGTLIAGCSGELRAKAAGPDGDDPAQLLADLVSERTGLHELAPPWHVSVQDCLAALAELTAHRDGPATAVRLPASTTRRIAGASKDRARAELLELAGLGAFEKSAALHVWHGADLQDRQSAEDALAAARRLRDGALGEYLDLVEGLCESTGLRGVRTPEDAEKRVDLLLAVRRTLDVFTPQIFERSLGPMLAATADGPQREEFEKQSTMERRRWRRLAREYLRPGANVPDLHQVLRRAEAERSAWRELADSGGWPKVPTELDDVAAARGKAEPDLRLLDRCLSPAPNLGGALRTTERDELNGILERLAVASPHNDALPRTVGLRSGLRAAGLGELLDDLTGRGVPQAKAGAEFDLCWWASVLEVQLDQATIPVPGEDRVASFQDAVSRRFGRTAARVADRARAEENPPVVISSPLRMSQLVTRRDFDKVIVAGAHGCAVPEGVLALARGKQSLVIGNPDGVAPIGLDDVGHPQDREPLLDACADAALTLTLTHQHRMPSQLSGMLAVPASWSVPAPDAELRLDLVPEGYGRMDTPDGLESPEAEVQRVVDLVFEHARTRPEQSLAVLATTRYHARRIADAVRCEVADHPELAGYFARHTGERFVVTDITRSEDIVRDSVLLSVGFGLTPRGRVPNALGQVDRRYGDRALSAAACRARTRLTVVSCFTAGQLATGKLKTAGARRLRALLEAAAGGQRRTPATGDRVDQLLGEFVQRLRSRGFEVEETVERPGWPTLAVSRTVGTPVAVMTDARLVGSRGADQAVRSELLDELQVRDHLRRFGWRTVDLTALDLFTDEEGAIASVEAASVVDVRDGAEDSEGRTGSE